MRFFKKSSKDLDGWINLPVKVLLNADGFYQGTLIGEMKNGLLIESNKKHIYIPFESVLSIEESTDGSEDG
jgi:hypothetical protein